MSEWVEEDCPACVNGQCTDCAGRGFHDSDVPNDPTECLDCEGSGVCPECNGDETVEVEVEVAEVYETVLRPTLHVEGLGTFESDGEGAEGT